MHRIDNRNEIDYMMNVSGQCEAMILVLNYKMIKRLIHIFVDKDFCQTKSAIKKTFSQGKF